LIYVKNISNHKITSGLSYNYDDRNEKYLETDYNSSEKVPGIFTEYTYQLKDRLTVMAGFRYDEHNQFGSFYTPRFHVKYQFVNSTSARFSFGKGYRNPHVFMENPSILASSKELVFLENLEAEEAWNAGFHIIHDFQLGENRPASLAFDLYRTDFQNQIVIDMEQEVQQVILYNLDGNSYSNSAQIEFESTLFRKFITTAAYRFNDVKTTYQGKLKEVPLNNKHKVLLVFSYTTPNDNWQLDLTSQFNGKTRFPGSNANPYNQQSAKFSPAYALLFGQIKRKFDNWEIYTGVENITNYRQTNPILAWSEPFSPYFDSSRIWGPTVGRRIYLGIRVAK